MDPQIFIIVTAYNEADRIEATLDALAAAFPGARVLLADDGSTDATANLAAGHGVQVVALAQTRGKGQAATLAAQEALGHARAARGEPDAVFLLCDGDLGASARRLRPLVETVARGEAGLAVAAFSRRVGGGFGLARGFARWAIRRGCGLDTSAPISGQRALSAAALADVLPFADGFGMEVGMTIDAVRHGHRLVEVEVELEHRTTGRTAAGFAHRARQLADFARAYRARGRLAAR